MQIGETTALTDNRDNQTYAIAKLADGNCWMIENLRLDNTPELSASNTNNPALPLINVGGTTSNHLSAPTTESWCTGGLNSEPCTNISHLSTENTTEAPANMASDALNVYSYGNYYNYYSATAGHGAYNMTGAAAPG